ncbi:MAG: sigma 54-interacting transcriptional regulator [Bryobacteraceae bacterium]|nr:sigma 54-interacting transcriptional regulator [Bryobacteraceae bacterium]
MPGNLLDALFRQAPEGMLVYGEDLKVTAANPAAGRILGRQQSELIGRSCREVFGCAFCEPDCPILDGPTEFPAEKHGILTIHGGNLNRAAMIRTVPLTGDSGKPGALAVFERVGEEFPTAERLRVVAESPSMRGVLQLARRVAASEVSTILLEGENGTGKDLIARAIHQNGRAPGGPFVAVNCAALPETLLESELFGHEKGAFTDARGLKRGLFELARGGTLFLDEIGEIAPPLQAKLLRALEDRTFRRLGGEADLELDARVIAAGNRNLREAVNEGAFRRDLFFRLNVIRIEIPPLRERQADILPLAALFVEKYNVKFKRHIEGLTSEAEAALLRHDWPGNVRELRNAIERAMILEDGSRIGVASLALDVTGRETKGPAFGEIWPLAAQERDLLERALAAAGGNRTQAARLLSITRDTLRYKMKKYGLT